MLFSAPGECLKSWSPRFIIGTRMAGDRSRKGCRWNGCLSNSLLSMITRKWRNVHMTMRAAASIAKRPPVCVWWRSAMRPVKIIQADICSHFACSVVIFIYFTILRPFDDVSSDSVCTTLENCIRNELQVGSAYDWPGFRWPGRDLYRVCAGILYSWILKRL